MKIDQLRAAEGVGAVDQRSGPRWALRNQRVRTRLLAMIAVPTVVAVVLGVFGLIGALATASGYGRAEALADLARAATSTVASLGDEQTASAQFVAAGRSADRRAAVDAAVARVDDDSATLRRLAAGIGDDHPDTTRDRVRRALFRLDVLPALRASVTSTQVPAGVVVTRYDTVTGDLVALSDEIAQGGSDPALSASVRALSAVSRSASELGTVRAYLAASLLVGRFDPGVRESLIRAASARDADEEQFRRAATVGQAQTFDDVVAGADVDQTAAVLDGVLRGPAVPGGALPGAGAAAADAWSQSASGELTKLGSVETGLVDTVAATAADLRSGQVTRAVVAGVIALVALLVALLATLLVARSLVRPLRALRAGALDVAGERLPALVGRLGREDPAGVDTTVEPIDVRSSDEIGEVARSFDEVHREAVRLAAAEARRRHQTGALFVNLSRRSQSLVERQLELIDDLERGEEEPDRLGELFRLDHLATRMRRNGENLLVLGGQEPLRRWNQAMPLYDVVRAATSEVEQYERVTLGPLPELGVAEEAVNDVVHLLAELVENATAFSARSTSVDVESVRLGDGSVVVEITDHGIGIDDEQYARLNERLAATGGAAPDLADLDSDVSRRMGLVVVSRLAARRGVRVRLRPAVDGVTASVTLPGTVFVPEETVPARRLPEAADVPGDGASGGAPDGDGSWIGERWSKAVATPGPGAESWFGRSRLPGVSPDRAEPGVEPAAPVAAPAAAGASTAGTATAGAAALGAGVAAGSDDGAGIASPGSDGTAAGAGSDDGVAPAAAAPAATPADASGFRPTSAGTTASGLPQRAPGANRVPGAGAPTPPGGVPSSAGAAPSEAPTTRHADRGAFADPAAASGPFASNGAAGERETRGRGAGGRGSGGGPTRPPAWDRSPAAVRRRYAEAQRGRARGLLERGSRNGRIGDAAEAAQTPVAAGTTSSGLPLRDPGANYVPGAADEPAPAGGAPASGPITPPEAWDRSAEAIRARFAAHQQGRQRAREAGRT